MVEPMEISKPYRDNEEDVPYRDNENGAFYDDSGDNAMVMRTDTTVRKGRFNNKWIVISIIAIVVIIIVGAAVSKGNNDSEKKTSGTQEENEYNGEIGKGVFNPKHDESNWALVGKELIGPIESNGGPGFGNRVAISYSGHRIAVGVTSNPNDPENGGKVDVFSWNKTFWQFEERVADPTIERAHAGRSHQAIALSGDGHRIAATQGDEVAVFFRTSSYEHGNWLQIGDALQPYKDNDEDQNTHFGVELCLAADGMTLATTGYTTEEGYVRVYYDKERIFQNTDPVDGWVAYPDIPIDKGGGAISLSADGKRIAVGTKASNDEDAGGASYGVVKVFELDEETNTWDLVGDPIHGKTEMTQWGGKLSLSKDGEVLAVGGGGLGSGVRVYKYMRYKDIMAWQPFGIPLGEELKSENFGADVALNEDGTILAVGAPGQPSLIDGTVDPEQRQFLYGRVHLFKYYYETAKWLQIGEAESGYQGDAFGAAIAITNDGTRLVAGAPMRTMEDATNVGAVRVYETNAQSP